MAATALRDRWPPPPLIHSHWNPGPAMDFLLLPGTAPPTHTHAHPRQPCPFLLRFFLSPFPHPPNAPFRIVLVPTPPRSCSLSRPPSLTSPPRSLSPSPLSPSSLLLALTFCFSFAADWPSPERYSNLLLPRFCRCPPWHSESPRLSGNFFLHPQRIGAG